MSTCYSSQHFLKNIMGCNFEGSYLLMDFSVCFIIIANSSKSILF